MDIKVIFACKAERKEEILEIGKTIRLNENVISEILLKKNVIKFECSTNAKEYNFVEIDCTTKLEKKLFH